jgi:DNA-binding IclR family transcriptional regulator
MRLGDLAPLHATSGGKAMLAFLPEAEREAYLATADFAAITPRTITSRDALRAQLERIRVDRVADVFEEFTPGIVGIAVPILSADEAPLGSINVALPAVRYSEAARAAMEDALRHAAAAVQERLAET